MNNQLCICDLYGAIGNRFVNHRFLLSHDVIFGLPYFVLLLNKVCVDNTA